mgnify:CR=1 FL=1
MKLDIIIKYLPLGTVIFIGLGILRTSIYYNYFGIDIMSYLSTSEVLTFFASVIFVSSVFDTFLITSPVLAVR